MAKSVHKKTITHSVVKKSSSKKKSTTVKKASVGKKKKSVSTAPVATALIVISSTPTAVYTQTTVALHHSATNCWTTISGSVYDLTPWLTKHQSNQQSVLSLCGVDSTTAFNAEYVGKAKPLQQLSAFLIGKLEQ
jgi:cytochrome b involved in lipid metabolism